jgi:hypothetical protein
MSLQETGSKTHKEIIGRGGKIINLGGITKEYRGLGFYIRESWLES